MNGCGARQRATSWVALAAASFLITPSLNATAFSNRSEIDTNTLLTALANALGGIANIQKIHTIYFEFKVQSFRAAPSNNIQTFQGRLHLLGREWLTSDGDDRVEIRSPAMQAPPSLEVLVAGQQSVSIHVAVTASTRYVPVGESRTCSGSSATALCVSVPTLYFDKVSPTVPPRAVLRALEANFSGTISESATCSGVATITPASGSGPQFAFTVTPLHVGNCIVRFASNTPQGWMLVGDQGVPNGNSTGQLQGPDLEREISHAYWTTFAFLTSSGLHGKVTYEPRIGAATYLLAIGPEGGAPIKAYLDRKTFLPDRVQIGNDPYKMVIAPKNWQSVDGVRFPLSMTVQIFDSQMAFRYTFTKIQVNAKLPENAFKQSTPGL